MAAKIIEDACKMILAGLKEGRFSKEDLEFLLKLFKRVVESTEALLTRIAKSGK